MSGFSGAFLALACAALAGFTPIAAAEGRGSLAQSFTALGYETVPLRRTDENHWFIFGRAEGRKRSCLVDTGWSFTTISTNTAARLAETNSLRRLDLSGVVLTNVPALTSDLRVNGEPTSYDVVLGCDFFRRYRAIIDCGAGKLYLRQPGAAPVDQQKMEAELKATGWNEIELREHTPPALTCVATVNGRVTELLVDSGAMWSCLDERFAAAISLRARSSPRQLLGPAANGKRAFAVADLKSWSLGSQPMPERTVAVLDLSAWGLGAEGKLFPRVEGILGGAELRALDAIIDCGNLKLWLRARSR
jgi:predicted aspartyl protease